MCDINNPFSAREKEKLTYSKEEGSVIYQQTDIPRNIFCFIKRPNKTNFKIKEKNRSQNQSAGKGSKNSGSSKKYDGQKNRWKKKGKRGSYHIQWEDDEESAGQQGKEDSRNHFGAHTLWVTMLDSVHQEHRFGSVVKTDSVAWQLLDGSNEFADEQLLIISYFHGGEPFHQFEGTESSLRAVEVR